LVLASAVRVKVEVSAFCITTLTERSLTSTASQVGSLQVRTTHGAALTVAYDGLTPSHPSRLGLKIFNAAIGTMAGLPSSLKVGLVRLTCRSHRLAPYSYVVPTCSLPHCNAVLVRQLRLLVPLYKNHYFKPLTFICEPNFLRDVAILYSPKKRQKLNNCFE
jgi:hypothetical protein